MTDAGLKISIIYTSVPDFFLCISYHALVYDQQSNYFLSKMFKCTLAPWECFKGFRTRVQVNQDGEKRKFGKKNKY